MTKTIKILGTEFKVAKLGGRTVYFSAIDNHEVQIAYSDTKHKDTNSELGWYWDLSKIGTSRTAKLGEAYGTYFATAEAALEGALLTIESAS